MKNKEEQSIGSLRGNTTSLAQRSFLAGPHGDTTSSLSRPARSVDTSADSHVLLETVATAEATT